MSRFGREYAAYQGGKADAYTKDAVRTFAGIRAAARFAREWDETARDDPDAGHDLIASEVRLAIRAALRAAETVEFEVKP